MTTSSSRWTFLSVLLLACAWPQLALAASCCGSILTSVDRLAPAEDRAVQFGFGLSEGLSEPVATFERDATLRVGATFRLNDAWQLGAQGAWIEGFRRYGDERTTSGWFADTTLSARWEPESLTRTAFLASVTLPTGRAPEEAHDRLGADATGRGAGSVRLGATWEHIFERLFLLVGGGAALRAPSRTGLDAGFVFDAQLVAGYMFGPGAAISAGVNALLTPALSIGGVTFESSAARRVNASISLGFPLSEWWSLAGAIVADPPVSGLSRNTPPQVSASLGVRVVLDE